MRYLFLLTFLFSTIGFAQKSKSEPDSRIDFFPLVIQMRYQDKSDQTRDFTLWNSFSINYIYQVFNFGAEVNQYKEESGTPALNFETKTTDYLVSIGYQFLRIDDASKVKASFLMRAQGYLGQNQVLVSRSVNGMTTLENADPDFVYGIGAVATGRFFKFFIAEMDVRILFAKNSSPQIIPAQTLRIGAGFAF